jgi:pilus assembly protein Flp/PilA
VNDATAAVDAETDSGFEPPHARPVIAVTATSSADTPQGFLSLDAAEGGCNRMELRDWLALARIELRREEGQTMTEYGVLLALIAVIVIVALLVLGPKIANVFSFVSSKL